MNIDDNDWNKTSSHKGKKRDKKLEMMRRANSMAVDRYGIDGKLKTGHNAPKKVTLVKMPWDTP